MEGCRLITLKFSRILFSITFIYPTEKIISEFKKLKSNIKLSALAGLFGFSATISWFYSFSLVQAALVRAVGQIELLFSYISSRFMFKEKIRFVEVIGIVIFIFGLFLVIFNK